MSEFEHHGTYWALNTGVAGYKLLILGVVKKPRHRWPHDGSFESPLLFGLERGSVKSHRDAALVSDNRSTVIPIV